MRRLALVLLALAATAPAASAGASVAVQLDRTTVTSRIGQRFQFFSTIRNTGREPLPDIVAHLNILSLDPGVYVDPEDWSSHRTRYLGTLAPGAATPVRWTVQAVNSGRFVLYVAIVDRNGAGTVSVSPPLRADVAQQRTLNSGGIVPLAIAIPAVLGLALLVVRRRRRALR